MATTKKTPVAELALKCLKARESGKRAYERADRLMQQLAKSVTPGAEIALNDSGRKFVLVDRYAGRDIVWTPCGARRWELKVIEP